MGTILFQPRSEPNNSNNTTNNSTINNNKYNKHFGCKQTKEAGHTGYSVGKQVLFVGCLNI